MSKGKVLVKITGSIAAYKTCQVISRLVQTGFEVEVAMTSAALKFVGAATIEGLTGRAIHTDLYESGRAMGHIHLIRWADLILLCPATASSLNKMASGLGDDLVSTLFLAHDFKKPYVVAPAMNSQMLAHPTTQNSLQLLSSWGLKILGTASGSLACGETGDGRLVDPEKIYGHVIEHFALAKSPARYALRVLVTAGGTVEPIDNVRFLANTSTGATGAAIADELATRGHHVTLLKAETAISPSSRSLCSTRSFRTFADLDRELSQELRELRYDVVIHAAAVSDFSLASINVDGKSQRPDEKAKIESTDNLTLNLRRNPKLVDQLRERAANPSLRVVAFKLTSTPDPISRLRAMENLVQHARPDFVVHNDASEVSENRHVAKIYNTRDQRHLIQVAAVENRQALASALVDVLEADQKDGQSERNHS